MKLRDRYPSFKELCDDLDESESEISDILDKAGYRYDEATNQFKGKQMMAGEQFRELREMPCRKLILATDADDAGMEARDRIRKNVKKKSKL